ncbi:MAG: hypothetical protein ACLFT0_13390 [Spirulinaceae cyanobacterium]
MQEQFFLHQTNNRSRFINKVLRQKQQKTFAQDLAKAYQDQASDPNFIAEVAAWDTTVGDGLEV